MPSANENSPPFGPSTASREGADQGKTAEATKGPDRSAAGRAKAADALRSGAQKLNEAAENLPGGERAANAARGTAQATEHAADYIRDTDVQGMLADAQNLVKRNPLPALLIAAGLGFLIARLISRD